MSIPAPGTPEWYNYEVNYYYELFGQSMLNDSHLASEFCKSIGFHIKNYLVPSLDQSLQDIYVSLHFSEAVEDYSATFHREGKIVYILTTIYLAVTTALYLVYIKDDYIKNSCVYNTLLSAVGVIIVHFTATTELVLQSYNCDVSFLFLNVGFYLWYIGIQNRAVALTIRSKLATLHADHVESLDKNIWVRLARRGFASDTYLLKISLIASIVSFIPGICVLASAGSTMYFYEISLCMHTPDRYAFACICVFAGVAFFCVLLYFLKGVVKDIYCIKYQLIAYCILFPSLGFPVGFAIVVSRSVAIRFSTGYFSLLYILVMLTVGHQTILKTYPLALMFKKKWISRKLRRKMKKRELATLFGIMMDDELWAKFCEFSSRCFTEENTFFIRRYIALLEAMHRNSREVCGVTSNLAFQDNSIKEKIKQPASFSAMYLCLFTYGLNAESMQQFDVDAGDSEKEILHEMYEDFLTENAPYELNIPSDTMKRIRGSYERKELSILMLENIKNEVITMIYENTFVKFSEASDSIVSSMEETVLDYKSLTQAKKSTFSVTLTSEGAAGLQSMNDSFLH